MFCKIKYVFFRVCLILFSATYFNKSKLFIHILIIINKLTLQKISLVTFLFNFAVSIEIIMAMKQLVG